MKSFYFLATILSLVSVGCSTAPSVLPDKSEVKVSREAPDEECNELGKFMGSGDDKESALENLKEDAANKGADYVQVLEYSTLGTRVTGNAFKCYN